MRGKQFSLSISPLLLPTLHKSPRVEEHHRDGFHWKTPFGVLDGVALPTHCNIWLQWYQLEIISKFHTTEALQDVSVNK